MRYPILAMVAALSLTSCATYQDARQDYLALRADGYSRTQAQRIQNEQAVQRAVGKHAYSPVIDFEASAAQNDFDYDLTQCHRLAQQRGGAGSNAVAGAVGGFLLGAAIGKAGGLDNQGAGRVARVGAVSGAVGGGASGHSTRQTIISNCMSRRGWAVIHP